MCLKNVIHIKSHISWKKTRLFFVFFLHPSLKLECIYLKMFISVMVLNVKKKFLLMLIIFYWMTGLPMKSYWRKKCFGPCIMSTQLAKLDVFNMKCCINRVSKPFQYLSNRFTGTIHHPKKLGTWNFTSPIVNYNWGCVWSAKIIPSFSAKVTWIWSRVLFLSSSFILITWKKNLWC